MKRQALLRKIMTLSVLLAAFAFTSLHAQTVAYVANHSTPLILQLDGGQIL